MGFLVFFVFCGCRFEFHEGRVNYIYYMTYIIYITYIIFHDIIITYIIFHDICYDSSELRIEDVKIWRIWTNLPCVRVYINVWISGQNAWTVTKRRGLKSFYFFLFSYTVNYFRFSRSRQKTALSFDTTLYWRLENEMKVS